MPEETIQALLLLGSLGLNIYTALDARATPAEAFSAIGRSRTRWMTITLFAAFLSAVGIGIGLYYLLRVRPALRPEIVARGLEYEVSTRVKVTRYFLPALALAVALALAARSSGTA